MRASILSIDPGTHFSNQFIKSGQKRCTMFFHIVDRGICNDLGSHWFPPSGELSMA